MRQTLVPLLVLLVGCGGSGHSESVGVLDLTISGGDSLGTGLKGRTNTTNSGLTIVDSNRDGAGTWDLSAHLVSTSREGGEVSQVLTIHFDHPVGLAPGDRFILGQSGTTVQYVESPFYPSPNTTGAAGTTSGAGSTGAGGSFIGYEYDGVSGTVVVTGVTPDGRFKVRLDDVVLDLSGAASTTAITMDGTATNG